MIKIPADQLINESFTVPEAKRHNHVLLKLKSVPAAFKSNNATARKKGGAKKEFGIAALDQMGTRYQIKSIQPLYTPPASDAFSHLSSKKAERARKFNEALLAMGQDRLFMVEFEQDYDTKEIRELYKNSGEVEFVEFQQKGKVTATIPNDPELGEQWALDKIQAKDAWDITTGFVSPPADEIIVAVLDSGVDLDHPDLASKIAPHGKDFVNNDNDPSDDNGHGTNVAGVIAAATNNGQGMAGVSWGAKILPIKVADHTGVASQDTIAIGISHAINVGGADVINISIGSFGENTSLLNATNAAVTAGVVVVASSGEPNEPAGVPPYIVLKPAVYPNVIAVGATNSSDQHLDISSYGVHMDLVAPGGLIRTTDNGGGYDWTGGSSLAAPHVSGTVALMRAINPNLNPAEIRGILRQTAEDVAGNTKVFDVKTGYGRLNTLRAVQQAQSALTGVTYTKGYNWDYTSEAEPSFGWARVPNATLYAFFPSWPDEQGNVHSVTLVGNGNTSWQTPSTQSLPLGTYWVNVSALVNGVWSGWIADGFHVTLPERPTLLKKYNNTTHAPNFFNWIWVPDPGATEYLFWGNWQPNAVSIPPPAGDDVRYQSGWLQNPGAYWTHIATNSKNGFSGWQPDWFFIQ